MANTNDYAQLVTDIRRHLRLLDRSYEAALFQFHVIGLRLLNVETEYGEGTIDRLATDVGRDPSFLYRARQLAQLFPDPVALEQDMEERRLKGVRPSIAYYLSWVIPERARFRLENLERRAMQLEADAEEVKAGLPEGEQGEVEGIVGIVQETRQSLHAHLDEGAMDAYVTWLKSQPCIFCGSTPCDAAHLPKAKSIGGDRVTAVCHTCHMRSHQVGLRRFLFEEEGSEERLARLLTMVGDLFVAVYSRRGVPVG